MHCFPICYFSISFLKPQACKNHISLHCGHCFIDYTHCTQYKKTIFAHFYKYCKLCRTKNDVHWQDSISNIKFKSKSWRLGIYFQKGKDIYIFCVRMFFLMWQYRCKRHYNKTKYVSTVYAKNREIKLKFRDLNIILRYLSRFSSDM